MKSAITALILSGLLTGCSSGYSKAPSGADTLIQPSIVVYTPAQLDRAAAEIQDVIDQKPGSCPMLAEMVVDYGVMRDQARAALGLDVDYMR